jgi:RNA polymerase sigma factor (sigma-70 family)
MQFGPGNRSFSGSPAVPAPWYVPDRRIRTGIAARHAAELAERLTREDGRDAELDDLALFTALHTCAYRMGRSAQDTPAAAHERETWCRRWREIREHLVKRHLGLAHSILGRFNMRHWDEDDRLSEAMYVLGRSVDRFNPWRGVRFSTYAYNAIVRALIRRSRRERRYRLLFPTQHSPLLERPVRDHAFRNELYAERLRRAFKGNLAGLTDLESSIIAQRFPRGPGRGLTFREIGHSVGLSKERVRQLESMALHKLRAVLESDPILR